ncbi:carbamoyltransferase C-terminal domain-containing protein [Methanococcus maripaludis]|uniref:Carbamoyltransferase n=2 Tax=Methanococcus maripaludis TaxID=39152 RepID=A0A7J9PHN2_METMI|nr:carbamoyltransferase C-terminal domain-containing protein [Methanococcus maripaludis]MBA2862735.1 carbamoyltransferase [Methanococcus maripaludis]
MILGICDGHNSSASLIDEKEIIYAASEERFTRKKNFRGYPANSIDYGINSFVSEKDELSAITVGGQFRKGERLKKLKILQENLEIPMYYFNHHLCHAASYKLSDFKECLILTMDGGGDGLSSTVSIGNGSKIETIAQSDLIDSVGDFYASITELLGFKPMEDEGKVMSLSSFESDDSKINLDIIDYNEKTKSFKNYLGVIGSESTKALKRILDYSTPNKSYDIQISKFVQSKLEEVVLKLLKQFVEETGIKNIVFSGGVAQNVKLNKQIIEQDFVDNLYVPPFTGDEGLSIGSSILCSKHDFDLKNTYLGYEIDNCNVEKIVDLEKNFKVQYIEENDISESVGKLISENKLVCVSREKMEFGPRALGNRSILGLPTNENAKKLAKTLKRNSFMPYAPTILDEYSESYLKNKKYSPYMTMLFDCFESKKSEIEGTVHVDGTTRAQTLKKEFNGTFYNTINFLNDATQIPAVLNTSFNLHGEPIVCNEIDAINSFKKVGDYLLLGNYLIEKLD